jgi:DNA-binding SARP family transcriptional activator
MRPHATAGRFYYRMLGTAELVDPSGTPVEPLTAHPKSLALLAYIILSSRGAPCSRDTLLAYFWPNLSVKRARHALRQTLYEIRQALGEGVLEMRGRHGVTLSKSRFGADVLDLFEALDEHRPDRVVALFRGELLPGMHVKGAHEFDAWLLAEREALNRRVSAALWAESRRLAEAGDTETAVVWGRQALVQDPYNESGLRDLMLLLAENGRPVEALRVYRRFRDRVRRQIGMKLGQETEALAAQLRRRSQVHVLPVQSSVAGGEVPAGGFVREEAPVTAGSEDDPSPQPAVIDTARRHRSSGPSILFVAILLVLGASLLLLLSFVVGPHAGGAEWEDARFGSLGDLFPVIVAPARDAQDGRATAMLAEALAMLLSTGEEAGFAAVDAPSPNPLPAARTTVMVNAHVAGSDAWEAQFRVLVRGRMEPVLSVRTRGNGVRAVLEAAVDTLGPLIGLGDRPARWDLLPANDAALAAYARGRQLAAQGRHHAAVAAFERALRADDDFALGWYRWATMPEGSFDAPARREAVRDVEGLARLPRVESAVLEAQRAYRDGEPHQAEALLRSLLARHPHNAEATYQLAEVLVHYNPVRGRPLTEARQLLERGIQLQPERPEALYHLSQLYLLEGDTTAFDRTATRFLKGREGYRTSQVRLVKARVDGDVEDWRDGLATLATDRDFAVLSTAHFLAVYAGDVTAALDVLAILTSPDRDPGVRSRAHVFTAELLAAEGQVEAAVGEFEMAMAWDAEHGASRAAHLMALGVLPASVPEVATLARRIIDAPSFPSRDVADWMNVESDLRPWLGPYARAAAQLALNDPSAARSLLAQLRSLSDASRGARLLEANLDALLEIPPVESSLPWWGVTPTEAILSPFYSLAATRYVKGRRAIVAGHNRQAELWFASLLDQSIPDLALAQVALAGQALALERSGAADAAAAARQRMSRLQDLAVSQ